MGFHVVAVYGEHNEIYIVRYFAVYYNDVLYKRHALLVWFFERTMAL